MVALGTVLLSGAVSVAILTTFAMHVLYGFVPPFIAFILNLIWIGLGLFLSDRHRSEAIAILTACAGYLVPFLVEGKEHAAILLFGMKRHFMRFCSCLPSGNLTKRCFIWQVGCGMPPFLSFISIF
ncbi:MAG: DUF2339 domain-containing protein [Eubacteriales bacterium]